jgi:signal peptidase II
LAFNPPANEAEEEGGGVTPSVATRQRDRRWIFAVLGIAMLVADLWIKRWCESHMHVGQFIAWPWPGILELRLTFNQGIAFGLAAGKGWLFTPIALGITIGAGWYSWRHPRHSAWFHTSMALLAAGALGNLYDRVMLGYVRDMFATRFIQFPVFNWADACITVATVILILVWSKEAVEARGPKPAPERRPETEPAN